MTDRHKHRPKLVRRMHRIEMPAGAAIPFQPEDVTILAEFVKHGERSIAQLGNEVYLPHNEPADVEGTLRVHISNIRKALATIDHTIWSIGGGMYSLRKLAPPEIDLE